jgi:hypothetical protein
MRKHFIVGLSFAIACWSSPLCSSLVVLPPMRRTALWRSSHACSLGRLNLKAFNKNDENEDMKPDPYLVKQELGQLFQLPRDRDPNGATSTPYYYSVRELEAFVQERAKQNLTTTGDISFRNEGAEDDDMFSVTLDAETYMRAADRLGSDGSLLQSLNTGRTRSYMDEQSPTTISNSLYSSTTISQLNTKGDQEIISEQELNRLNEAWKATQATLFSNASSTSTRNTHDTDHSEALHKQVFMEEQGFLNQSSVFLESLLDEGLSNDAWVQRHGSRLRTAQDEAMAQLDEQIFEIQQNLQRFATQKDLCRCSRCSSMLDKAEIRHNEGVRRKICRACHADDLVRQSNKNGRSPSSPRNGQR